MSPAPLDGIRVLDISRILAAPLTAQLLGDLGAEIIKVERPAVGDDARQYGPPFWAEDAGSGMSAFYLSCNRNKQSVTVDFTTDRGKQVLLELIEQSDVLMENFRPGVLAKYGLGYDDLCNRFPRLVYCSVTGFGQTGPYRDRPGYDGIFQALSGMMSISGLPDGVPGAGPMKSGLSLVDILTGLHCGIAILAALRHRDLRGEGQYLDVSLLECGMASMSHIVENYLVSGAVPERRGNGGFGGIPSQAFKCADGKQLFIVATTNPQFARTCRVLGHVELIDDPRFASIAARIDHRLELLEILESLFSERDAAQWISALEAADVPVGPVNDIREALADEHVRDRGIEISMEHQKLGAIPALRYPIRMSRTPVAEYSAPPTLGEHTREILTRVAGLDESAIDDLERVGAI